MQIELRAIEKSFGQKKILNKLNADFAENQVTAIIGKNGCGKSTILKIVALLLRSDQGELIYDGQPLSKVSRSELKKLSRKISFCFQHPRFFNSTVFKNLQLAIKIAGKKVSNEQIIEMLEKFSLKDKAGQNVHTLSGGEKQILQIIRALILDPELIILDEPTASLDYLTLKKVETILDELKKCGRQLIITSHNQFSLRRIADYYYLLADGNFCDRGNLQQICRHPGFGFSHFQPVENIFLGRLDYRHSIPIVRSGQLQLEVVTDLPPGEVYFLIRPEDIFITRQSFSSSSARNSIRAKIKTIENLGIFVSVTLSIFDIKLTAFITPQSLFQMDLKNGDEVYCNLKSTAIELFRS